MSNAIVQLNHGVCDYVALQQTLRMAEHHGALHAGISMLIVFMVFALVMMR